MKHLTIIIVACGLILSSCASMFNGAVLPNQCKKCEVIDKYNQQVLTSFEGCGSENTRLEEQAKIAAYDLSRDGKLCNLEVVCESWKKDPEAENQTTPTVNQKREN